MTKDILIHVCDNVSNSFVGMAFLVENYHILTCAHVVNLALGRQEKTQEPPEENHSIKIKFIGISSEMVSAKVSKNGWYPCSQNTDGLPRGNNSMCDIAILESNNLTPSNFQSGKLYRGKLNSEYEGKQFLINGYPEKSGGSERLAHITYIGMLSESKWIQVETANATGHPIQPGYSGAPVFKSIDSIIGMVASYDNTENSREGFIIPSDLLVKACDGVSVNKKKPRNIYPKYGLANYGNEQDQIKDWLEDVNPEKRIIFLNGEKDSGKSAFLSVTNETIKEMNNNIVIAELTLIHNGLDDLFDNIVLTAGLNKMGSLDEALYEKDSEIDARIRNLTRAFIKDIEKLPGLFLLVIDAYDKATTQVGQWITSKLLGTVKNVEKLRIIVAGEPTPEEIIEWAKFVKYIELSGVIDKAEDWLPVLKKMDLNITTDEMTNICNDFGGQPALIMQVLEIRKKCGDTHG